MSSLSLFFDNFARCADTLITCNKTPTELSTRPADVLPHMVVMVLLGTVGEGSLSRQLRVVSSTVASIVVPYSCVYRRQEMHFDASTITMLDWRYYVVGLSMHECASPSVCGCVTKFVNTRYAINCLGAFTKFTTWVHLGQRWTDFRGQGHDEHSE